MNTDRWAEVDALLDRALELEPAARVRLLEDPTTGDPELRAEVNRLLGLMTAADGFLEGDAGPFAAALLGQDAGVVPDRIGAYRIVSEIGRGGMGTVYLAERADGQLRQQVALKVLRRGLDTEDTVRRFRGERQILATLSHPNIARVFDAGTTDDGRPYYVMEHVEGRPITAHAAEQRLNARARLHLFMEAGRAVSHAHARLVVHRDLKPSNILVTAAGEVKLLDFGIAKVLEPDPSDAEGVPLTRTGVRLLTPGYASPEQLSGDRITTATDIYQLGLVLHKLLTDRLPEDGVVITESDKLRGDLATIVRTAIHPDPQRRYATVDQLVEDIRRYLAELPISARPDTLRYRAGLYARRKPAVVGGIAIAGVVAIAYVAAITRHAEQLRVERERAVLEAATADHVSNFLVNLFAQADPDLHGGSSVTALQLVEWGQEGISSLDAEPAVQARVLGLIGDLYSKLGRYDDAMPLLAASLELRSNAPVAADPGAESRTLNHYGMALMRSGRRAEALPFLEQALAAARAAGNLTTEANVLNDLGLLHSEVGDYDAAESYHREALEVRRAHLGDTNEFVGVSLHNLGLLMEDRRRYEEAESLFVQALRIKEVALPPEHTRTALTLGVLGRVYGATGRSEEGAELLREAMRIHRARLGPDHPHVALNASDLGANLALRGELAAAEELFREAVRINRLSFSGDHAQLATSMNNLGWVLSRQERLAEALELQQEGLAIVQRAHGDRHQNTAIAHHNIADLLWKLRRLEEAERHSRAAIRIFEDIEPGGHPLMTRPLTALARILRDAGRLPDAAPVAEQAIARRRSAGEGATAEMAELEAIVAASARP